MQAQSVLDEAQKEAKKIASEARKDAKEKREKAESSLNLVITYAFEIRQKAEQRAREIGGQAYDATRTVEDYQATIQAL